jgi:ferredoxin-NADP reductase
MPDRLPEQDLHLVVAGRCQVADDVVALDLRAPGGGPLPAWTPGAHVDVIVPGPDGPLVRQYSLCGDPDDVTSYRVAVLREPTGRGGSAAVHATLFPGTAVAVRGPRNRFALDRAPQYVFVAGGIGITPVLAMVRAAVLAGARWHLAYGGRTVSSMAFVDEVSALAAASAGAGEVALHPLDVSGPLPVAALVARAAASGAGIWCCGPEGLLEAVEQAGCALGPGRVHVERFRAADPTHGAGAAVPFEIEVASHGVTVTVPADRTALEVLEEAGVPVLSSCLEGTCGTCEVSVLAGTVDHRDALLTPAERAAHDTMFVCVSRSAGGRLVVEV